MAEQIAGLVEPRWARQRRATATLALGAKRGLDIVLGIALAVAAVPVLVTVAVAIRLDSPGPILFRTRRVGKHGKPFLMLKFRTMVKDAEDRLQDLAHLNVAERMVKIPDDPRVTRVGNWLRRYSLDELPQILNVLAGHMSLVGPRPHDLWELPVESLEQDPRLSVRPGLTGLWQISARSDPKLATRIYYDLHYVNRWSLLLDAKILAKTVPVVMMGRGGSVDSRAVPAAGGQRNSYCFQATDYLNGELHQSHAIASVAQLSPDLPDAHAWRQPAQASSTIIGKLDVAPLASREAAN